MFRCKDKVDLFIGRIFLIGNKIILFARAACIFYTNSSTINY